MIFLVLLVTSTRLTSSKLSFLSGETESKLVERDKNKIKNLKKCSFTFSKYLFY